MSSEANGCGYAGKSIIAGMAVLGIILSSTSARSCDFLSFENKWDAASDELMPPFNGVLAANVGIYNYEILSVDTSLAMAGVSECTNYNQKFDTDFEVLATAQITAICGPVFAGLALIAITFDACLYSNYGCFLFSVILFLAACGTQAGTFALYAEPSFCIDSTHECGVGSAGIQSAVACVLYWLCCVLTCCFPRPDPFCDIYKRKRAEEKQLEASEPQVIEEGYYYKENEEEPRSPPRHPNTKTKKKRKKKRKRDVNAGSSKSLNANITQEDFNTPDVHEGVERVEVKEKAFPDGSRQVDEITHYTDGTSSTITKEYRPGDD